jgi:hypothetical protein
VVGGMVGSAKRVLFLIAALAAAATLTGGAGAAGGGSSPGTSTSSRIPTLYVLYAMNCTFTFANDSGQTVTSIPPGSYEVDVRTPVAFGTVPLTGVTDLTACHGSPMFQLQGPGVNLFTNMTAGCSVDLLFPETFQAGATYTAEDLNQPAVTKSTLTIQTSGSPTTPTPITVSGAKGETQQALIGSLSGKTGVKATLIATLEANGKIALTLKGNPVKTLPAGKYKFSITDMDPKGSFILRAASSTSASNLTGVKFVGKKLATVTLKAGSYDYYAGKALHVLVITRN